MFLSAMGVRSIRRQEIQTYIDYTRSKRRCSKVCMSRRPSAIKST